ncbi:HalOD1 output domain-containing protein [Halorussus amylolyticus]|uniref:HalOD1 output domain-containing protein n=1 Tax=Halorussus amylolyticus TaxID=1126242 RepID=UPI00104A2EBB|nr:HalOD1 output domain-containing protein [Halorussus amylolyticus]
MSKTETHTPNATTYEPENDDARASNDAHERDENPPNDETPLRVQADWSGTETLDSAITCAISRATGAAVTDLAPLYEYMDPDALHEFVESMRDSGAETTITFEYEGHDVSVRADGEILVWPSS